MPVEVGTTTTRDTRGCELRPQEPYDRKLGLSYSGYREHSCDRHAGDVQGMETDGRFLGREARHGIKMRHASMVE